MKRVLIHCLSLLLFVVPVAVAKWARVSLEALLKETDVIVVARLTGVRESTKNGMEYGSATLTIEEVLRGSAKKGDKLRLEWANQTGLICPRVEHAPKKGKTMIWLLQTSTNSAVTANYPGRVLDLEQRSELDALLNKK